MLGFLSPDPGAWPGLHVQPAPLLKSHELAPPCWLAKLGDLQSLQLGDSGLYGFLLLLGDGH